MYSRPPLSQTLEGNGKLFEIAGVWDSEGGVKIRNFQQNWISIPYSYYFSWVLIFAFFVIEKKIAKLNTCDTNLVKYKWVKIVTILCVIYASPHSSSSDSSFSCNSFKMSLVQLPKISINSTDFPSIHQLNALLLIMNDGFFKWWLKVCEIFYGMPYWTKWSRFCLRSKCHPS